MPARFLVPVAALLAAPALAQAPPTANDGTDPAQPAKSAALSFQRLDLAGGGVGQSLFADFNLPLGDGTIAIALRLPLVSVDTEGDNGFGAGDIAVQLIKVLPTDSHGAIILGGEMAFDTASRPELGTGKTVLTGSMIVERILPDGTIIAPTVAHSIGLWGRGDSRVGFTRLNLYVAPGIGNPRLYFTIDPAVTIDWAANSAYADVAATLGYQLGRLVGGDAQVFIRPSAGLGEARSFNWGVEIGLQRLNFR